MASLMENLYTKLFCKYIGQDEFGNKYYLTPKRNYLNQQTRMVLYKGIAEPSKVPPMWHAWLHYLIDKPPFKGTIQSYSWEKDYLPNLTGTKFAHYPNKHNRNTKGELKNKQKYQAWAPKN